jgi:hypothetical protein
MWRKNLMFVVVVYGAAAAGFSIIIATGAWREMWEWIRANVLF